MSAAIEFPAWLKTLAAASDPTGTNALVFDAGGQPQKANASALGMQLVRKNAQGAVLAAEGLTLVVAVDMDDPGKVILYTAWREAGKVPVQHVIHANGLTLGACNVQGTMNVTGGTNVAQYALRLGTL